MEDLEKGMVIDRLVIEWGGCSFATNCESGKTFLSASDASDLVKSATPLGHSRKKGVPVPISAFKFLILRPSRGCLIDTSDEIA